jgi:hypothetical protein
VTIVRRRRGRAPLPIPAGFNVINTTGITRRRIVEDFVEGFARVSGADPIIANRLLRAPAARRLHGAHRINRALLTFADDHDARGIAVALDQRKQHGGVLGMQADAAMRSRASKVGEEPWIA